MFFDDWAGVVRVLVVGTCAYFSLLAALRVSGTRTLAKLNAFDFVVTVALGSTLATVQFLVGPMRRMRITEDEIRHAVRTAGHARLGAGAAVVLETDGSLSILTEVPAVLDQSDTRNLGGPGA